MIGPEIKLVLGTALLALLVSYGLWIRYRVWVLRQDLFEIRDRLWDGMRASGRLDDHWHRYIRDAINGLIRFAPRLSVLVIIYMHNKSEFAGKQPEGQVPRPVEQAINEVSNVIFQHTMNRTLLGILVRLVATVVGLQIALIRLLESTKRILFLDDVRYAHVS